MPHLALVGDSVFDNGRYTAGAPDVVGCLRPLLPSGWTASLNARDGTGITQVGGQLARLPKETTHLVVSMGGNDLWPLPMLMPRRTDTTMEFLGWVTTHAKDFEKKYRLALAELCALGHEVTVCTVYGAGLPDEKGERFRTLLGVFDDLIVQAAGQRQLRVIELRAVCVEPSDFVNSIEPSAAGGRKIAAAIAAAVCGSLS